MSMNRYYKIIFLLSAVFISFQSFAQDEKKCQQMDNEKAVKLYQQGMDKKNKKEERLDFLKKALDLEPDYVDANFAYAEERIKTLIYANASFKPTEPYFKKVIQLCPNYHSDPPYYLGFIYYEEEKWDSCTKYLKLFLNYKSDDDTKFNKNYPAFISQAKDMMKYAKSFSEIMGHPVPFDPKPVAGICTDKDEYLPIIAPDDESMLYTRKVEYKDRNATFQQEDNLRDMFCISKRNMKTGIFDKGGPMPPPFNEGGNEGGATISIDNKHLYFTMGVLEKGGNMNYDIYYSDYSDGEWSKPKKVEGINDPIRWDSQPSLASDGKTLYFASDRLGGYGGIDIYVTKRDDFTGLWSKPANLGRTINTNGDEKCPFIHSDFQTLYFSSSGQPGIGGFDIFYARKNDKGEWLEPKNIGVPINTNSDDLGFFVSTDGHLGYFTSSANGRIKGKSVGGLDIYSFELYKEARPDEVAFFKGNIEDKGNSDIKKFDVEVKDAVTKKVTKAMVDTLTGTYAVMVNAKEKHDLIVTIKKDNYAFSSQLVSKDSLINAKPAKVNMVTDTLKIGQTYPLNDIYYATNAATLDPRSLIVLEEFIDFLRAHPSLKIEIYGHTDNVGNEKANLALSADRAFTVRDILLAKGINESRLLAFKGFGSTQPVADNSTPAGRAKNRRTEFKIVEK